MKGARKLIIREMTADDVDAVRYLHAAAFTPYLKMTGRGDSCPAIGREPTLACLAVNPSGCFVAEDDGIVGYVFSRYCGEIGWIGPFGVHPDQQGRGLGRLLLMASSDGLERAGCRVIGLETMPDSPYNVGMYIRAGFRPEHSTLILDHQVRSRCGARDVTILNDASRTEGLAVLSDICRASIPGLDYANLARNALEFGLGETILIGSPEPWAAAIMKPIGTRVVVTVVGRRRARSAIGEVVQAMDAWASDRGLDNLSLAINAADWQSVQYLLDNGFNVCEVRLRMLLKGEYPCPDGLDMSRWAM
jgi:ribosomal protein S18 acetylase RimI-like enzyme